MSGYLQQGTPVNSQCSIPEIYDKRVFPASSASLTPLSDNPTSTHPVNLFSIMVPIKYIRSLTCVNYEGDARPSRMALLLLLLPVPSVWGCFIFSPVVAF